MQADVLSAIRTAHRTRCRWSLFYDISLEITRESKSKRILSCGKLEAPSGILSSNFRTRNESQYHSKGELKYESKTLYWGCWKYVVFVVIWLHLRNRHRKTYQHRRFTMQSFDLWAKFSRWTLVCQTSRVYDATRLWTDWDLNQSRNVIYLNDIVCS